MTHHGLRWLGWTAKDAREAFRRNGVTIAPPAKSTVYRASHLKTSYLEGEDQRRRKAMMRSCEGFMIGLALRNVPVKQIGIALMVTDEAILKRLRKLGITKSTRHGRLIVHRQPGQQKLSIVEVYDDDSQCQPAA